MRPWFVPRSLASGVRACITLASAHVNGSALRSQRWDGPDVLGPFAIAGPVLYVLTNKGIVGSASSGHNDPLFTSL
jgi:hypothetical protein